MNKNSETELLKLLQENQGFIQRLARGIVLDGARADDVVQKVWLAALRRKPDPERLRPWLSVVTRFVAKKQVLSEVRTFRREQKVATGRPEGNAHEAALTETEDTRQQIVGFVSELKEPYRSTILLHYFEGLSMKEIAKRQGVSFSTARSRVQRALAKLRVSLESRYGDRGNWVVVVAPLAISAPDGVGVSLALNKGRLGVKALLATPVVKVAASFLLVASLGIVVSAPSSDAGPGIAPDVGAAVVSKMDPVAEPQDTVEAPAPSEESTESFTSAKDSETKDAKRKTVRGGKSRRANKDGYSRFDREEKPEDQ